MTFTLPRPLKIVADYVFQVVVGALLFSVALVGAAAIAGVVHLLAFLGFSPDWFKKWAEIGEKVVFGTDLFLFVLFLLGEVAKFIRALFQSWRE